MFAVDIEAILARHLVCQLEAFLRSELELVRFYLGAQFLERRVLLEALQRFTRVGFQSTGRQTVATSKLRILARNRA